uniref:Uncharacterized protein n=1 Tax=Lygus hesperus TaxID=30085 RepID=A0A0A9YFH3_LYGHE
MLSAIKLMVISNNDMEEIDQIVPITLDADCSSQEHRESAPVHLECKCQNSPLQLAELHCISNRNEVHTLLDGKSRSFQDTAIPEPTRKTPASPRGETFNFRSSSQDFSGD